MLQQPRCEVAARCGGCPLIDHDRAQQHAFKERTLRATLAAAGLTWNEPIGWTWSTGVGYRNRVRLRLEQGKPGFFNPHKLQTCLVLSPELQELLRTFEAWSAKHRTALAGFSHLELRAPDADGTPGLELVTRDATEAHPLAQRLERPLSELAGWASWVRGAGSPPLQRFQLTDTVFTFVPLGAFMQVNSAVNRLLIDSVRAEADSRGVRSFIDLYCGSGNSSLPLLAIGSGPARQGRGVELQSSALEALQRALLVQELKGGTFLAGDALTLAGEWASAGVRADLVIVNPPRAGLRRQVEAVSQLAERAIALCYCSVQALARDIQRLLELGCTLQSLHAFDMFPHTAHVELLAWLSPRSS